MTQPSKENASNPYRDLLRDARESQAYRYLDDPVGLLTRLHAEAERRNREGVPVPEVPPPDGGVARLPPPAADTTGGGRGHARRRDVLRYGWYATAATTLLGVAGAARYWLRGGSGPETVRPPEPPSPTPLVRATIECDFELWGASADGEMLRGNLGDTPVDARRGDWLIINASASNPTLWAFFARTPDGTIIPVMTAGEATARPGEKRPIRLPIDSDGEWLVAAVATPDERGYREVIRTIGVDAEFRRPLGANRMLAYANGSAREFEVLGAPPSVASVTARARFEQFCRRLAERAGGETRAVAVPVGPNP